MSACSNGPWVSGLRGSKPFYHLCHPIAFLHPLLPSNNRATATIRDGQKDRLDRQLVAIAFLHPLHHPTAEQQRLSGMVKRTAWIASWLRSLFSIHFTIQQPSNSDYPEWSKGPPGSPVSCDRFSPSTSPSNNRATATIRDGQKDRLDRQLVDRFSPSTSPSNNRATATIRDGQKDRLDRQLVAIAFLHPLHHPTTEQQRLSGMVKRTAWIAS